MTPPRTFKSRFVRLKPDETSILRQALAREALRVQDAANEAASNNASMDTRQRLAERLHAVLNLRKEIGA